MSPQESQEQGLRQRLLDEQFAVLRRTAAEAQRILQDAVGKLDDPLHLRCTCSPGRAASLTLQHLLSQPVGRAVRCPLEALPLTPPPCVTDYLVSRAQAALAAVSALETGHAQYLTHRSGECRGLDGQAEAVSRRVLVPQALAGPCPWRGFPQRETLSKGSLHPCPPGSPVLQAWGHRPGFGSHSAAFHP